MRKNNFVANNHAIHNLQDQSPGNTTNLNSVHTNNSGERKLNNTNNFQLSSEASNSQTRYGITQLLNSLNSTSKNNDTLASTSLKDSKHLIKINHSKKRLDTARKSRLQQLQGDPIQNQTLPAQTTDNKSVVYSQAFQSTMASLKKSFIMPKLGLDATL